MLVGHGLADRLHLRKPEEVRRRQALLRELGCPEEGFESMGAWLLDLALARARSKGKLWWKPEPPGAKMPSRISLYVFAGAPFQIVLEGEAASPQTWEERLRALLRGQVVRVRLVTWFDIWGEVAPEVWGGRLLRV